MDLPLYHSQVFMPAKKIYDLMASWGLISLWASRHQGLLSQEENLDETSATSSD